MWFNIPSNDPEKGKCFSKFYLIKQRFQTTTYKRVYSENFESYFSQRLDIKTICDHFSDILNDRSLKFKIGIKNEVNPKFVLE